MASAVGVISVGPSPVMAARLAPVPLDLGLVETFGILTPAAVGNAAPEPVTVIRGDVGAGGALTGFPPGIITGTVYEGQVAIDPMMIDLQAAYDDAAGRVDATPLPASLDGGNFAPGVHHTDAAIGTAASGEFTLDGGGDPDAVFIFQIGGALAFGADTTITLAGGAQAHNVFWQVVGAGGLGANTKFVGTLMASTAIDSGHGSTVNGRLLSLGGAITVSGTDLYSSPPSVSIDGGLTDFTTTSSPLITGVTSARPPMTVTISVDGVEQTPAITPSDTGIWSFQSPALVNGEHTIVASSVDGAGNVGSFNQTLDVDTILPSVTIDGGEVVITNDRTPTISGTTDVAAGEIVTLTLTRTTPSLLLTRTALVQGDQTWSISPNGFTAGEWTVVALVADPAGNENTDTQTLTVDVDAPEAAITSNALTNDPTPTITGTTEVGATVAVSIDGLVVTDVVQGENWSATSIVELGHGNHNATVTATDTAGNATLLTQTLDVDLVLPVISINPGPTDSSNDSHPTIVGTTDVAVGVTVSVSIDGDPTLSALVQSDGWNVTPSSGLSLGEHAVVATVADPAGNIGTAEQTLIIDTIDPTVIIDGGSSRTTRDATPAITGSSPDVPIGSTVVIRVAEQTMTTTIQSDGTFAVTAVAIAPNDSYVVSVTVTDAAGNSGTAHQSLTVNAIAPTVAYTNGSIASTNDATPLISGTTDAAVGSAVVVTVEGQSLFATVQSGGSWNVTAAALVTGPVTVSTSITDPDGNVGTAVQTLTVDSTTPTLIVINGGASVSTNDDTPTISGTTDAADGRLITVTVAGQTLETSATKGTWVATATHIADGIYEVTAAVDGLGGNPGSATQSLTIDTVDPVVVIGSGDGTVQTTDPTPDISGSGATPGSTVTVVVDGQTLTTVVEPDGTWSVTPTDPLPAGDNPVTVTITDPAGNTGTGTQTINVAPLPPTTTPPTTTPPTTTPATPTPPTPTPTTADYTPVGPKRVFDTRAGSGEATLRNVAKRRVSGGYELEVKVTGLAGYVPSDGVGAVSLNVTATGSTAAGFITVYACGVRRDVSSVNFPAGKTVANAVITPVSASGTVCFFSYSPTDIIVDVNGWFASGAGFSAVGPERVFDTRSGASPSALRTVPKTKLAAGTSLEVRVTDLAGFVPADGVGSVSLNVVVTNPEAAGFITVYSCGALPDVSSVNYSAGQTVANAVIAPVSASGTVCFHTYAETDMIVDINGWIASGSSFHGIGPARVLDTRTGNSPGVLRPVPATKIGGGNVLQVKVTDLPGYTPATGVAAVSLNVTATGTEGPGFITVFACGAREGVSSLNYGTGATVANAVIAPVSNNGTICLYSIEPTDIIVDINGWIGSSRVG